MSLDLAIRLTEIMLAFVFIQQSIEHFRASKDERLLFVPRIILSVLLIVGFGGGVGLPCSGCPRSIRFKTISGPL